MTEHLKPREQGDIGELSAMSWFTEQGARVFIPLGHSPDVDLVAILGERSFRVEVKTGTYRQPNGNWSIQLATHGGNRSWTGLSKDFDPNRCDLLFVHAGDGRRWLIPTGALECRSALALGGQKYSEFEIDRGPALRPNLADDSVDSGSRSGEYPSGQRTAAVNRQALPSQVRILSPPSALYERLPGAPYQRPPSKGEQVSAVGTVYGNRCMTLPRICFGEGRLSVGSKVRIEPLADGRILLTPLRRTRPPTGASADAGPQRLSIDLDAAAQAI